MMYLAYSMKSSAFIQKAPVAISWMLTPLITLRKNIQA